MKKIHLICISYILSFAAAAPGLCTAKLPLSFSWQSSHAVSFYPDSITSSRNIQDKYQVAVGIDTTFADGIHTVLEATNENELFGSRILLQKAMISYQQQRLNVILSIQDKGFGAGYHIHQKRVEHPLHDKNALVDYRWYGIESGYRLYGNTISIGMGSNDFNGLMYQLTDQYIFEPINLTVFGMWTQKHSHYNDWVYQWGGDICLVKNWLLLRQGIVWDSVPVYLKFRDITGWKSISQLTISPIKRGAVNISRMDQKRTLINAEYEHILDADVEYGWGKTDCTLGTYWTKNIYGKSRVHYLDVAFFPVSALRIGFFVDVVRHQHSQSFHRMGLQTSYRIGDK
jgi:hypothetical protein